MKVNKPEQLLYNQEKRICDKDILKTIKYYSNIIL